MKKLMMFLIACLLLAGWQVAGYCELGSESASADDSGITQSESAMDANLGSEVKTDEAQSENEIAQVDESVDSGGMTN
jgi:hypothetical protein